MGHIVIRHNMPWVTKVHNVSVEMFGLTDSIEEAKTKILAEVNERIDEFNGPKLDDDYTPHLTEADFEVGSDGTISLLFENLELAYDIIECKPSFEAYTNLVA